MGLYDDGGVEFAQQAFDSARERGIEQAKKAQKEGRKQELLDTFITKPVLSGIQSGITQAFKNKGEALQAQNIPMRSYLENYLNAQQNQRTSLEYNEETNKNGFIVNGTVDIARLQNYIANDMYTTLNDKQLFANLNPTQLDALVQEQSKVQADELRSYYQNLYNESLDVPDMQTILDEFDKWNSRENPTNVFGRITKGLGRFFGRETEETLNFKNLEASENLRISLGENTSQEMIQFRQAVADFDAASTSEGSRFNINGLIDQVKKKIESGELRGRMIEDSNKIESRTYVSGDKTYQYFESLHQETSAKTGLPILAVGASTDAVVTKIEDIKPLSGDETTNAGAALTRVLNDGMNPEYNELMNNIVIGKGKQGDIQSTTNYYIGKVGYASRHIRELVTEYGLLDGGGISEGDIDYLAATYIMQQVNSGYKDRESDAPSFDTMTQNRLIQNPNTQPDLYNLFALAKQNTIGNNTGELQLINYLPSIIQQVGNNNSRLIEIRTDLHAAVVGFGRDSTGAISSVLPEAIDSNYEGTNEEKVLQYELNEILAINSYFPDDLKFIDPKYQAIADKFNIETPDKPQSETQEQPVTEQGEEETETVVEKGPIRSAASFQSPQGSRKSAPRYNSPELLDYMVSLGFNSGTFGELLEDDRGTATRDAVEILNMIPLLQRSENMGRMGQFGAGRPVLEYMYEALGGKLSDVIQPQSRRGGLPTFNEREMQDFIMSKLGISFE